MKAKKLLKKLPIVATCVLAIACGVFVGNIINSKYFKSNNLNSINAQDLIDDVSLINYKGKTPDELSATEVYVVAYHILENKNSYNFVSHGNIKTSVGVNQTTYTHRSKNGNDYYYEFATYSSMIKKASRFSFVKGGDINMELGEPTDESLKTINYSGKFENHTYEEYYKLIGREATATSNYLVSKKTVTEESSCQIENGNYTYTLTLNPLLASITSRQEIAYVSNVDENSINFLNIQITFTVDKEFNLISQTATDEYKMKYAGIGVTVNGYNSINFD